ncbi:unnamed protein product, partial [Medioppia subpectinata]
MILFIDETNLRNTIKMEIEDNMDLKSSSFINVTLAFWTNDNGLAIPPQALHQHNDNENSQLFDTLNEANNYEKHSNQLLNANTGEKPISDVNRNEPTVQRLISSLLSDQFLAPKEESALNGNDNISGSLIANITKRVFENLTDVTNDTLLCSELTTNDCIWRNMTATDNSTHDLAHTPHPDRVYWALFLVILPILALFGNILVILRTLQTVTNWFIVSLAFADLFVTIPMVFSLYVMAQTYGLVEASQPSIRHLLSMIDVMQAKCETQFGLHFQCIGAQTYVLLILYISVVSIDSSLFNNRLIE